MSGAAASTGGQARARPSSAAARQARLWYLQRISAMVLAICVVIHIAVIIYAVRGGLDASEILGRTRGNLVFGGFYAIFVLACAVHAPIGLLKIAEEWWRWRGRGVYLVASLFGLLVLAAGLRAVWAVTMGGAP